MPGRQCARERTLCEAANTMTNFLARTIALADAMVERELEAAEILMRDCGSTAAEIERALGVNGYTRKSLERDRAEQIAAVERWLTHGDDVLH